MKINNIFSLLIVIILVANSIQALQETQVFDDYEIISDYDANDVESGESFSIKITIKNTGDLKEDITFEFDDSFPFDIDGDNEFDIISLGENQEKSKSFRIDVDQDANDQRYDIEFTLEDSQEDYDGEIDIEVNSILPELIISDIQSTPQIITPDMDQIKLIFTIDNTGGGDAEFTRANLILPDGMAASESFSLMDNLQTIKAGESKEAEFYIDTSNELIGGQYTIKISLDYEDENNKKGTQTLSSQFIVHDKPLFDILDVKTNQIIPDTTDNRIEIKILNIGKEKGEETSIKVFENNDLPVSFDQKTQRIGSLEKNQEGTAIFNFEVDSDALPKEYLVKIQTRTLNQGNVITQDFSVPLVISEKPPTNPTIFLLIIPIIAIVILIYLTYSTIKKK